MLGDRRIDIRVRPAMAARRELCPDMALIKIRMHVMAGIAATNRSGLVPLRAC